MTDRCKCYNIKRGVAGEAVAKSTLVLEHNQWMNLPHTTEGKTAQFSGER